MKSRTTAALLSVLTLVALSACDGGGGQDPTPVTSEGAARTPPPDLSEHESGPESPIAYGLFVPEGATQLGPLFRYRSDRLIQAYRPDLEAAEAQSEAVKADKIAQDEANGTPAPSPTPTPTPTSRPSDDSFRILEETPRPDTTISLMRIDGSPSDVVRRMLAQVDAALPEADVELDDLSAYCTSTKRRITGCEFSVRGKTEGSRDIRITMRVDPGRLADRTSAPATLGKPVMEVTVQFVGEPRAGQLARETGSLDNIAEIDPQTETSGLIWPKMDEDAPPTTKLVDGWVAPTSTTLILSGFDPQFAMVSTRGAALADQVALAYVTSHSRDGRTSKDVAEDLNSVSTTYTARTANGGTARAINIMSARGNYTTLFYTPPAK
ncbi:MAG: hypothetical protein JWR27_384 [Aeromicrobium sp.]|jgi:hypothetical protein|nr:hypothetical protein [Aeromicrobium sp.]